MNLSRLLLPVREPRTRLCPAVVAGLVWVFTFASGGCVQHLVSEDRLERGVVIVIPGIEGRSVWNTNLALGLDEGGVDCGIEIFDWGIPGGVVLNLVNSPGSRSEAMRLRRRISAYQADYPGRPVVLVGHSGGAGIAVFAAESMLPGSRVDGIFLLAAALSRDYSLGKALRHSRFGIQNCHSAHDRVLLQLGTTLVGNIDRKYGPAAGKDGFSRQPDGLVQVAWEPSMRSLGHDGGHFGWTHRRFARDWVAPRVTSILATARRNAL